MAVSLEVLGVGSAPDDETGDTARDGGLKIKNNFAALETQVNANETAIAGKLSDVVDDTTPQLGGDLDTNGNAINGAAVIGFKIAGESKFALSGSGFYPLTDAGGNLGLNNVRWENVYADKLAIDQYVYWSDTYTVGSLPAATTEGLMARVTDATAPEIGATVTGGGAVSCVVYADGTNWKVVAGGTAPYGIANVIEDATPQLGGALDGQGNDLNNLGVVFLTEQAAAEADVAGKGQHWVKTATPNRPMFTDDAGADFELLEAIFSAHVETVANQEYVITYDAPFAGAITTARAKTESGTCTVTGEIDDVNLGGTANSASSTASEQAHSSANTYSKGAKIAFTVSSNSSATDLEVTFYGVRTA